MQWAALNSTPECLCYTLTSPPVSGMTRPKISTSRKYTYGLHQTPEASLRHLTIACSRLSSALTKPLPYLSEAKSSLNCLMSTTWSRMDHVVIVSLKARTSIVTQPHLASGCSASPSNARSKCKISSHILFNSKTRHVDPSCLQRPVMSKTRHVLRTTRQQC